MRTRLNWLVTRPRDWKDLENRPAFVSRAQVLEPAVHLSRPVGGNIVEFGVWKGFDADPSTACALDWVAPLLEPGALLLFDEF